MILRATRVTAGPWRASRLFGVLAMAGLLMGCAERISLGSSGGSGSAQPLAAAPAGPVSGAPLGAADAARRPPPVSMAGRWTLSSPGGGTCAMNFGGAPGAAEGTIAPEGGCPGNFFTSRKWVFGDTGLVIRDHTGQALAQLAFAPPGRFDGQATTGQAVNLAR
jgi:hypothetical protein